MFSVKNGNQMSFETRTLAGHLLDVINYALILHCHFLFTVGFFQRKFPLKKISEKMKTYSKNVTFYTLWHELCCRLSANRLVLPGKDVLTEITSEIDPDWERRNMFLWCPIQLIHTDTIQSEKDAI